MIGGLFIKVLYNYTQLQVNCNTEGQSTLLSILVSCKQRQEVAPIYLYWFLEKNHEKCFLFLSDTHNQLLYLYTKQPSKTKERSNKLSLQRNARPRSRYLYRSAPFLPFGQSASLSVTAFLHKLRSATGSFTLKVSWWTESNSKVQAKLVFTHNKQSLSLEPIASGHSLYISWFGVGNNIQDN